MGKGDLDRAEQYHMMNIELAPEINDLEGVGNSYNNLGNIYNERGEYKRAMMSYTEAAKINSKLGNIRNAGINNANIGLIHQKLENYNEAIAYYTTSDSLFRDLEFLPGQAFRIEEYGDSLPQSGQIRRSAREV